MLKNRFTIYFFHVIISGKTLTQTITKEPMKKLAALATLFCVCIYAYAQHESDSSSQCHKGEMSVITYLETSEKIFKDPFTWGYRKFNHAMVRFGHSFGEQPGTELSIGYPIFPKKNFWMSPNVGILKNTNTSDISLLAGTFLALNTKRVNGVSIIQYSFGTEELVTLNEAFYNFKISEKIMLSPGFTLEGLAYRKIKSSEEHPFIEERSSLFFGPLARVYTDGFFFETGVVFGRNTRATIGVGHIF